MNELTAELLSAAISVLDDFDTFGEVLQVDDQGEYGPTTAIERLRTAIEAIGAQHNQ